LRRLLLRAIRESSVPQLALEELCQDFAGNLDEVAVARIRLILNDLGAELDERIEYTSTTDDFRVSVSSTETIGEELEVEAAIALLDDLNSNHNDLVRIYLREALRSNLLDAKEEIALSQSMERAIASALDALVDWPLGIQSVIKSADDARVGKRQLNSVTSAIDEIPAPNF
jgi:RNA polymerase primary sigma factor